ncbi:hypothetical protein AN958_04084 [Leucoagaricus sp. SymC.cos]|nr:hypothetical protein AN958_04084 [Leucoagaricus sp. SymC.cos]
MFLPSLAYSLGASHLTDKDLPSADGAGHLLTFPVIEVTYLVDNWNRRNALFAIKTRCAPEAGFTELLIYAFIGLTGDLKTISTKNSHAAA